MAGGATPAWKRPRRHANTSSRCTNVKKCQKLLLFFFLNKNITVYLFGPFLPSFLPLFYCIMQKQIHLPSPLLLFSQPLQPFPCCTLHRSLILHFCFHIPCFDYGAVVVSKAFLVQLAGSALWQRFAVHEDVDCSWHLELCQRLRCGRNNVLFRY